MKSLYVTVIHLVITLLFLPSSFSATTNYQETFDSGTCGWLCALEDHSYTWEPGNINESLILYFRYQGIPKPTIYLLSADTNSSDGAFVGNYIEDDIKLARFKIFCEDFVPGDAYICMYCESTYNPSVLVHRWYYQLDGLKVGEWVSYDIPIRFESGWSADSDKTKEQFEADLTRVKYFYLSIQRAGMITDAQSYYLDDVELIDSNFDTDGDGISDYLEVLAGTDYDNPFSVLSVDIMEYEEGILLTWPSVVDNSYSVRRISDLMVGFDEESVLATIQATNTTTTYLDTNSNNFTYAFYSIFCVIDD